MKALLAEAKALGAAAVLLVPPPDQARHPLTPAETEVLTKYGFIPFYQSQTPTVCDSGKLVTRYFSI